MSTTSLIRDALKKAPGPLTATEIAESIGEEATPVRNLLYALVKTGEVAQDKSDDGKPTFLRNPDFVPSRRRPGEKAADEVPAPRTAKAPKAAKPAKKAKKAPKRAAKKPARVAKQPRTPRAMPTARERALGADVFPVAAEPMQAKGTRLVSLQVGTLRTLLAAIFASDVALDARTRLAVLDATKEAA